MDNPIVDDVLRAIQYLEDLTKDPDPRIDSRWFESYRTREEERQGAISVLEGETFADRLVRYPPPHATGFEKLRLSALPKFKIVGEDDERD